jgi:hypothetical protein
VNIDLDKEDRKKVVCDKYLKEEISIDEMYHLLEITEPKQLKPITKFTRSL